MSTQPDDIAEMRETYIRGLDENVPGWRENVKPGSFGCHEALDRASLLMGLVDDLSTHPAVLQREEWYRLASQACGQLHALYQSIGDAHIPKGVQP